ncbi:hypothetical protein [Paenibacillus alkalitolerans]|uniref:hypothetical protein n=1 Tax=Paenibacillus alkalitolerans TaxID=2799335 RepID=UPI0018F3DB01|nr:hypothetical protein [Paenibacillus alkalitolerans]
MDQKPKRSQAKALSYILVASLSAGSIAGIPPSLAVAADAVKSSVYVAPAAGKVSLGGSSYIELKDVNKLGRTVRFTVSFTNGGSSDINFIDYWVKLRSATGSQFSVTQAESDKNKTKIAAKSTETFTFYTTVGDTTKLSDLSFDFIKWDFSQPSFQRTLGTIRIPATYKTVTPAGSVRSMLIADVSTKTSIKRVNTAKTGDEYVTNLTFVFENTGSKSFVIPAYEYAVVTSEGLSYPLKVTGLKENESLHPRFKKEITLNGELPATVSNKGWQLVLSEKKGESSPMLPVSAYSLPASSGAETVNSVPVNGSKELIISDQKVQTKVEQLIRNENDKNYLATVRFSFVNQGKEPVTLPKYIFKIRTSSGLTYPAAVNMENIRLDPLVEKEVEMKVTIPLTAEGNGWRLVMEEPVESSTTDGDQVALFDLSNDNASGLNQGASYDYSNDNGTYNVTFNNVQRLPWEDQDILSASFTIANKANGSLPIPELQGYFMLDGKIKVEAKMVNKDALIAVQPGTSIGTMLYGKIPYTYDYSTVEIVLEEKKDENTAVKVVEFSTDSNVTALPVIDLGKSHNIEGAGRSAAVSMRSVRTYEGLDGGNLFTALIDVKNLEKRYTDVTKLVGHFKSSDGLLFPVQFTEYSGKVAPQGTATLLASASIPASVNTAGLQLVLGESIIGGTTGNGSTPSADAYMNAVDYKLPAEPAPKSNFEDLTLFPYTITLKNVRARMTTTERFAFSFDYELSKNSFVQNADKDHKLTIELVDKSGSELLSKTFTLGDNDSETNDTRLELGKHSKLFEDDNSTLFIKLQYSSNFEIHVYDEYEGVRKKLASIPFDWYSNQ